MKKLITALVMLVAVCRGAQLNYTTAEVNTLLGWADGVSSNYNSTNLVSLIAQTESNTVNIASAVVTNAAQDVLISTNTADIASIVASNYLNVSVYGMMMQHDLGTTNAIVTNTVPIVVLGMDSDYASGMTFQNGKEFLILRAGKYNINWNHSGLSQNANKSFSGGIGTNDVELTHGADHGYWTQNTRPNGMGGHAIIDLVVSNRVSMMIANQDGAGDFYTEHANFTIIWIGE